MVSTHYFIIVENFPCGFDNLMKISDQFGPRGYVYFKSHFKLGFLAIIGKRFLINSAFLVNALPTIVLPIIVSCSLLITYASSLDPDQARQNVRPDLDPN